MWHALSSRSLGFWKILCVAAVCAGVPGCGSDANPGSVRFVLRATPPPDDGALSPLTDPRLTNLDLRDASTDAILARARIDPTPAGMGMTASINLSQIAVSAEPRGLRMLALGAAGQQLLGLALQREVFWKYGEFTEIALELRRPLFFFGGSLKMVAPTMPLHNGQPAPYFAPNQQIFAPLRDETKLRVIDPNAVRPLLSSYDRQFDVEGSTVPPVTASAGTFDGQSLLVASQAGNLHIVDTLRLESQSTIPLHEDLPVQSVVVDPLDQTAALLLYRKPSPVNGRAGRVLFVRDLANLRAGISDGQISGIDIDTGAMIPEGVPLAAAYAPDGFVDVIIAIPPLQLRQPDCTTLSGSDKAALHRYDPHTGQLMSSSMLPYTTAIAYTTAAEQVLVQPCVKAPGAVRLGQVVIRKPGQGVADRILPAPGSATLAVVGNAIISVGSQDIADSASTIMGATVRILEPNTNNWATSEFELPAWQVPWVVSNIPSSVDILFLPTDVMSYGIAVNPDRTHALVLMRVLHQTFPDSLGLFLQTYGTPPNQQSCYVQWAGYTYHVLLINLQNGTREQDYLVGVQNQSCTSSLRDNRNPANDLGACFGPCLIENETANPYLLGYQDGYIPSAASVLFGRL